MIIKRVALLAVVLLGACASSGANLAPDDMNIRASELTKLSAAVEAYVRYDDPAPGMSQDDVLQAATKGQPQLLSGFSGLKLKVLSQDRHAVLLVCDKDGTRALLEDAGCTGKMDIRHWETRDVPCRFTVSVQEVCRPK